jgi:4-oxalmesaconate hydratase
VIIDCHGHYTTTPPQHARFRASQLTWIADPTGPRPTAEPIADDEIRESIEENQLRVQRERGVDVTIFSPKALGMEHHVAEASIAKEWARANNDLIHRVQTLFPEDFAAVCQLPQTPDGTLDASIEELERCVLDLGFVGCNLNPDPSGGFWTMPPLTDRSWYPIYEKMVELEVPAMIHVSASCNPSFHPTGAHYLNADTTAFMQLLEGDLFADFPDLRFVIPHGGGAVPYHWGRYRGLASRLKRPPVERLMANVSFDTCVYHQAGIELLFDVIDVGNIVFASEMLGAVPNVVDPETGHQFDDTKRYIDDLGLSEDDRRRVFEENVRRVYPRLDRALVARHGEEV